MNKSLNFFKKISALHFTAAVLIAFFSLNVVADSANSNEDCSDDMARETQLYMQMRGIRIPDFSYTFTDKDGDRLYSLFSKESFVAGSVFNKNFSVIYHKNNKGESAFYEVNLESKRDSLIFTVFQHSLLLETIRIDVPGPVVPSPLCDGALTPAQVQQVLQDALAQANATCQDQYRCLFQEMGGSCAYVMYVIEPTSWRCNILEPAYPHAVRAAVIGGMTQASIIRN